MTTLTILVRYGDEDSEVEYTECPKEFPDEGETWCRIVIKHHVSRLEKLKAEMRAKKKIEDFVRNRGGGVAVVGFQTEDLESYPEGFVFSVFKGGS